MPVHLSVSRSISLSRAVCLSVCLPIVLSSVCLSVCLSVCTSVHVKQSLYPLTFLHESLHRSCWLVVYVKTLDPLTFWDHPSIPIPSRSQTECTTNCSPRFLKNHGLHHLSVPVSWMLNAFSDCPEAWQLVSRRAETNIKKNMSPLCFTSDQ